MPPPTQEGGFSSCCWEPGRIQSRALLGRASGAVSALDLATGRLVHAVRGGQGKGGHASGAVSWPQAGEPRLCTSLCTSPPPIICAVQGVSSHPPPCPLFRVTSPPARPPPPGDDGVTCMPPYLPQSLPLLFRVTSPPARTPLPGTTELRLCAGRRVAGCWWSGWPRETWCWPIPGPSSR